MTSDQQLIMSFDPKTIEHLGVKMYSRIPSAIAELIANAYDAGATQVNVNLHNTQEGKSIEVLDNGWGMDFDEVNEKFLRIGRNRRIEGAETSPCGTRKATGKKGLGKLALFGIGNTIEITTIKKDSGIKINFVLDWEDLKRSRGDYKPDFTIEECDPNLHGTTIVLKKIKRSSDFNKHDLAVSLSKLFNFFDEGFKCFVRLNNDEPIEVNNELKFSSIDNKEFEWIFPQFSEQVEDEYEKKNEITGKIIATETPIKPGLRGITLFANGRLVNEPEFFGVVESSHVFSYLTGWLNIDFIDDMEEDVIATNRQSLNWDEPGLPELQYFLQRALRTVERDWREKRKEKRKRAVEQQTEIDLDEWYQSQSEGVRSQLEPIVKSIVEDSELTPRQQSEIVRKVHVLIPEYAQYHWRNLHPEVQETSERWYQNEDYYTALEETVKGYIRRVKRSINSANNSDHSLMGEAFSVRGNKLNVTKKYKRPDGTDFEPDTIQNIREGQKSFSESVVSAVRNPLAHERYDDLRESGLFSEKDCLDALGLVSYLSRRLDDALETIDDEATPQESGE